MYSMCSNVKCNYLKFLILLFSCSQNHCSNQEVDPSQYLKKTVKSVKGKVSNLCCYRLEPPEQYVAVMVINGHILGFLIKDLG